MLVESFGPRARGWLAQQDFRVIQSGTGSDTAPK